MKSDPEEYQIIFKRLAQNLYFLSIKIRAARGIGNGNANIYPYFKEMFIYGNRVLEAQFYVV